MTQENSGLGIFPIIIAAVEAAAIGTSVAVSQQQQKKAAERSIRTTEERQREFGIKSGAYDLENVTGSDVERDPVFDLRKWALVAAAGVAAYLYLRR